MRITTQGEFSKAQLADLRKAKMLSWLSLVYLSSVAIIMYLTMGTSQAMKTVWIEDMLSMVAPIMFLIGNAFCSRKPNAQYPYGFHACVDMCFLGASIALMLVGAFVVIDSAMVIAAQDRPTIGLVVIGSYEIWGGWLMYPALLWGTIPPIFLGKAKIKLSRNLYDKVLYTDAKVNKADGLTAAVAIIGVTGFALGWWWLDAIAALIISIEILEDGFKHTKDAITVLMNKTPTDMEGKIEKLPMEIKEYLKTLDWVKDVEVRFEEEGHILGGEIFLSIKKEYISAKELDEVTDHIKSMDWRLQDIIVTVTEKL